MGKLYLIHSSTSNNELYHYGIKGQKWGFRRYQNEDGTLTPEGKRRYYNSNGTLNRRGRRENKRFYKDYKKNWWKTYNKAAERHNLEIQQITKKYEGVKLYDGDNFYGEYNAAGKKYIKEVSKKWKNIYVNEIMQDYGPALDVGYGWINDSNIMMLNMFDDAL